MKSPGGALTFSRTHTVLVSQSLILIFFHAGIKVTMIIVSGSVLRAGVIGAAGAECCHLQPHH